MGEVATPNRLRPVRGFFSWHGYPPRAASTRRPLRAAAGRGGPMPAAAEDADPESGRAEGVGVLVLPAP